MTWLDNGSFDSLSEASSEIKTIRSSQELKIGFLEEVAWRLGHINS